MPNRVTAFDYFVSGSTCGFIFTMKELQLDLN